MTRQTPWGLLGLAVMALALGTGCSKGSKSEVVAAIDGVEITKDDVYQEIPRPERDQALFTIIVGNLVQQEAEKAGISVTEQDVSEEISRSYGSMEAFQEHVEQGGLDMAAEIGRAQTGLLLTRIATKDVTITEDDIQRRFEETKGYYTSPPAAKMREIRVVGRDAAEEVLRELKTGADFENLAAERSVSPVPRGDWGSVTQEQVAELPIEGLADTVFSSQKGDLIGPYAWPVGETDEPYWSVFWIEDLQPGEEPSLDDARIRAMVELDTRLSAPGAIDSTELQRRLISTSDIEILSDEFANIQQLVTTAAEAGAAPSDMPEGAPTPVPGE